MPYTIEMNHHHPKGAGGTRDAIEVGWINDRAGPLTGPETSDSKLIDADGNVISTTCAVPASMRLSSPELSLTQQQEAVQVVSGSGSYDQRKRPGQFDSKADFQRNKRNRKFAHEAASGDKGQKWRARARLVLEMISNGRLHFRMIPGAEHIQRGMWPLPTLDQLIYHLDPRSNGGKGLFDVKTREEVLEERSQRFALTLKTAEEVNNEAYLMKQPEESQKDGDDDEQMGEAGADADWLKPSPSCHAFWTSESAATASMFPPVRAKHRSPTTSFYPGGYNPLQNTRTYPFADHIDQSGTNDGGWVTASVLECSISIEQTLMTVLHWFKPDPFAYNQPICDEECEKALRASCTRTRTSRMAGAKLTSTSRWVGRSSTCGTSQGSTAPET